MITHTTTSTLYGATESFDLIVVDSPECYAVISLYGGQILEYRATGKPALLWLSPNVSFTQGKAIRGGVPICAPWFGPHKSAQNNGVNYPNHGFARTSDWQIIQQQANETQAIISLSLSTNEKTLTIFPYACRMEITFTLSDTLNIEFSVTNLGDNTIPCEWALHSYFTVEDVNIITVEGLSNRQFVDSANNNTTALLTGQQTFDGQVDRYFINGSEQQTINTTPAITVIGNNCDSVITWNPGTELAANMPDIGSECYQQFVCVERGAIFDNQWHIAPHQQQRAVMTLSN